jgi:hypothetical protein
MWRSSNIWEQQNYINEEVKSRLNSENACYDLDQSYLFIPALRMKMLKYKTKHNSLSCFVGCETWSLTLRKEHRLRVFENRVLRRIFGPKGDEVTGK